MASANTQSANEPAQTSLVHTVQLEPTIKAQISGRTASIYVSDVVTASVYSQKTRLKKLLMMIVVNRVPKGIADEPGDEHQAEHGKTNLQLDWTDRHSHTNV